MRDWNETDLRLSELHAWARSGYRNGKGYCEPRRHPALDRPRTPFEKIVSRLDKKLAKKREEYQDLAEPTNWLAIAAKGDLGRVKARWELPSLYLDFLARFSPKKVILGGRRFWNGLLFFGASELIDGQQGYAFTPSGKEPIVDWPAHLVVIASHGGDPFVLDLSKSDGTDAPVYSAIHGLGAWKFRRVASSFRDFLEQLAK